MKIINSKWTRPVTTGIGKSGVVVAAAMIGLLCLTGLARAEDVITSKVHVTPPKKQFSGDEWRAISLSANRVLKHVDKALDALADKKNDVASANIEKGLTLVKILNGVLPGSKVKTEIKGAGITYKDVDDIKPAFVPIYREYDLVDVVSPVKAAKQAAGKTTTPSASKTAPEYTYAGFDYTGIKLNVRLAKRDLLLAQDLIKQGDTKGATAALQDIQNAGVIFEFSTLDEPLVRAMDNLRLAEAELKNNRPEQAKIALRGAVDALKNYEKHSGASRVKEVQKLHQEIDKVAKNLAQHKSESFSKKVSEWWSKCLSWFSK
jgi:hypothetical protein